MKRLVRVVHPHKGPYQLSDLCRIVTRTGARIGHQQQILASILALIPVDMTLQLGKWPTIAGQSESSGDCMTVNLYQAYLILCLPIPVACRFQVPADSHRHSAVSELPSGYGP